MKIKTVSVVTAIVTALLAGCSNVTDEKGEERVQLDLTGDFSGTRVACPDRLRALPHAWNAIRATATRTLTEGGERWDFTGAQTNAGGGSSTTVTVASSSGPARPGPA